MSALDNNKFEAFLNQVEKGLGAQEAALIADLPASATMKALEAGRLEAERLEGGSRPRKTAAASLELWTSYRKAQAEGRAKLLRKIEGAGIDDWKALAFVYQQMNTGGTSADSAYYMGR